MLCDVGHSDPVTPDLTRACRTGPAAFPGLELDEPIRSFRQEPGRQDRDAGNAPSVRSGRPEGTGGPEQRTSQRRGRQPHAHDQQSRFGQSVAIDEADADVVREDSDRHRKPPSAPRRWSGNLLPATKAPISQGPTAFAMATSTISGVSIGRLSNHALRKPRTRPMPTATT